MADFLYPELSVQQCRHIEIMRRLYIEHPDYFSKSSYPEDIERYFRSWFQTPVRDDGSYLESQIEGDLSGSKMQEHLYKEVVKTYSDLKNAKPSAGDSSETMAYFRTAAGLLEKMISYQERCMGIKQVADFHAEVMRVMEEVLSEDQRNEVIAGLKKSVSPQA